MPLRACPDCSREVSDRAPTCPQCGHPFQVIVAMPKTEGLFMQSLNIGCLIALGLMGFVALLIFFAFINAAGRG